MSRKIAVLAVMLLGAATFCLATPCAAAVPCAVPEIDGASLGTASAFVGSILVMAIRRRKN
jgi:hypothetical protein